MTPFRCMPIATETADLFRRTGLDDNGNTIRRVVSDGGGAPCKHCLRGGSAGQTMLLSSYNLPGPLGIYWTPSPIFLHDELCARYEAENDIPEIVRASVVSVRSYDAAAASGCSDFLPDACLVNRYEPGAQLSLHQDRNERGMDSLASTPDGRGRTGRTELV